MAPYSNEYILQYVATLLTKGYTDGLEKMKGKTQETTKKLTNNFNVLSESIGGTIAQKLSLAGAAIYLGNKFRLAIKDMVAYQKQMSMFNTLLKGSREELNRFADEFIQISIRTGQAKETIIEGAYQALSSGIPKEALTDFIETAAKTATAGKTSTETAIATMASVMNAYKMSAKEAGDVADWLLTIQNKGVTTVDELGKSLANITSVAAPLGIGLNDIGAALAVMTQNGKNTAESTTLLKSALSELAKSGQKASDEFEKIAGTTFLNFIKQGGTLKDALDLLDKEAQRTGKTMLDMFGSVDAGNAAMLLTGKNAGQFAERLQDVSNRAGEMEEAYKTASDNIATEWDKLCNVMNSKWYALVKGMERPITITLRLLREGMEDKKVNELDQYKKFLADTEKELAGVQASINRPVQRMRPDNSMQNLNFMAKENELLERRANLIKKIAELEQQEEAKDTVVDTVVDNNDKIVNSTTKKNEIIQAKEKEHKLKLTRIENNFLMQQKDYIAQQQKMLNDGLISKEEYNKNIENKNKDLKLQQQKANLELYKEMEDFYKSVGDLANAEQNKKHVIEIELDIQKNITTNADQAEQDYLQAEAEKRKQYQTQMIADEWEYLTELMTLKESSNFSKEQIDQIYEERMQELEVRRLEREQEELQNRLNFYNSDIAYKQQAVDTMQQIRENEIKIENLKNKKQSKMTLTFENYKSEIRKRSLNALQASYEAFAKGEMKSLEDFKKFAQMQLVELMASLGAKHLEMAISEGGLAVIDFARAASYAAVGNPQAAALFASGNEHLGAAALNASLAAAWGAGGAMVANMGSGSSSSSGNYEDEKTENMIVNNQVEAAQEESEGMVYVNVSNSALTKLLIKNIEKELKDGYNVSLIAKKKR